MKKFFIAVTLLLAISGIGFAQTTPAAKPAAKTETSTKHAKKTHSSKKTASPEKAGAEKKN